MADLYGVREWELGRMTIRGFAAMCRDFEQGGPAARRMVGDA